MRVTGRSGQGRHEFLTLKEIHQQGGDKCMLTFSHPEVAHGLTYKGIPQVNLDMMNPRRMMDTKFCMATMGNAHDPATTSSRFVPDRPHNGLITTKKSGGVLNYISRAMKLTRGKLIKGRDCEDWLGLEWKQLD